MNRAFANRLYLIITVVVSITSGFITGYIVGSRHPENYATHANVLDKSQKDSSQDNHGTSVVSQEGQEKTSIPDIKVQSEEGLTTSLKESKSDQAKTFEGNLSRHTEDATLAQEEKVQKEMFSVQAGAFRNEKEAEALKTKLEKKGYNVYVVRESRKGPGLFKVRVGDFETKKEAEVLAVKLKKAEGLQAFAVRR